MQRGGTPTVSDRVLASKLGSKAVHLLLEGKGGLAVGIENGKVTSHDILDLFDESHRGDYDLLKLNADLSR